MKQTAIIGIVAAVVIAALATVNAAPSLPNIPKIPKIPGIGGQTGQQIQQGVNAVNQVNQANQAWSFKEERGAGRVLAARVANSFGGIVPQSSPWSQYVNKIGRGLAVVSNRPDIKYRFAILNTDDVNAYSCPGGYIFVTRGLLRSVKSEAALAGVLAHEIAHVSEKHIEKAIRKQKVAGVALEQGLSFAASEGQISDQQADMLKKLGDAGYDILVKKGLDREDELEADRIAVKTMAMMGYNPSEYKAFVGTLGGKDSKLAVLASTHPAAADRVKAIEEQITKKMDGLAVLEERLEAVRKASPL